MNRWQKVLPVNRIWLNWCIEGSARASRAVSSVLAGNTGEGVRKGRRTRPPGQLCSPFHNPQSEFRRGNGRTGRVPQGGTEGNSFPEIILEWTTGADAPDLPAGYLLYQNPAPRVTKGDVLAFIGFLGNLRIVVDDALGVGRAPYAIVCCSVDGLHFFSDISRVVTQPSQLGRISGCLNSLSVFSFH